MNPDDTADFSNFCFKEAKDFHLRYCMLSLDAVVNAKAEKIRTLVANHWIEYLKMLFQTRSRICLTPLVLVIRTQESMTWAQLPKSIQTKVWTHFEHAGYRLNKELEMIIKL